MNVCDFGVFAIDESFVVVAIQKQQDTSMCMHVCTKATPEATHMLMNAHACNRAFGGME